LTDLSQNADHWQIVAEGRSSMKPFIALASTAPAAGAILRPLRVELGYADETLRTRSGGAMKIRR
jgi:hypothetical protein